MEWEHCGRRTCSWWSSRCAGVAACWLCGQWTGCQVGFTSTQMTNNKLLDFITTRTSLFDYSRAAVTLHRGSKTKHTSLLFLTSPNANLFSVVVVNLHGIVIIQYPVTARKCRYTTLREISSRFWLTVNSTICTRRTTSSQSSRWSTWHTYSTAVSVRFLCTSWTIVVCVRCSDWTVDIHINSTARFHIRRLHRSGNKLYYRVSSDGAVYAMALCPSVCLSVLPSVRSRSFTKVAKLRIMLTAHHHAPGTLVLWAKAEMDMGWVHPCMGWVGSHFPTHVMGWVGLNEKYCYFFTAFCAYYVLRKFALGRIFQHMWWVGLNEKYCYFFAAFCVSYNIMC